MGASICSTISQLLKASPCLSKLLRLRLATLSRTSFARPGSQYLFPMKDMFHGYGIAIEDGLLSLDSRLVDSVPEYVPPMRTEWIQISAEALADYVERFQSCVFDEPDRRSGWCA